MNIEIGEFGSVIAALLVVGAILKHAFPSFPNNKIPLVTFILGTLAYVAMVKGWGNVQQWIAGVVAAVTATGAHSSVQNVLGIDAGKPDEESKKE
ncbi:MAG TPA: phage holin family protein [Verrucomicrobiota bacterium]|nr:phage holin family protein [Verrucomicrobiota bacterium]HNS68990.1 phage holin family protein [Verrucomicrobiota bacterium]